MLSIQAISLKQKGNGSFQFTAASYFLFKILAIKRIKFMLMFMKLLVCYNILVFTQCKKTTPQVSFCPRFLSAAQMKGIQNSLVSAPFVLNSLIHSIVSMKWSSTYFWKSINQLLAINLDNKLIIIVVQTLLSKQNLLPPSLSLIICTSVLSMQVFFPSTSLACLYEYAFSIMRVWFVFPSQLRSLSYPVSWQILANFELAE